MACGGVDETSADRQARRDRHLGAVEPARRHAGRQRAAAVLVAGETIVDVDRRPEDLPDSAGSRTWAIGPSCRGWLTPTCTSTSRAGPSGRDSRPRPARRRRAASPRSSTCRSTARPSRRRPWPWRIKLAAAAGKLWVDCGFYGGVVPGNERTDRAADRRRRRSASRRSSATRASTSFPNATEADLRAVMPELAGAGLPLLVHAELIGRRSSPAAAIAGRVPELRRYLASRPRDWEHDAIRLLIALVPRDRLPRPHRAPGVGRCLADDRGGPRGGIAADRRDVSALSLLRRRGDPRRRHPVTSAHRRSANARIASGSGRDCATG